MSLIGLRKGANFFSVAGTVLSSLALAGMGIGILGTAVEEKQMAAERVVRIERIKNDKLAQKSHEMIRQAEDDIREFREQNDSMLPGPNRGLMLVIQHKDAWGQPLSYEVDSEGAKLVSAGADQQMGTSDDLIRRIVGTPMAEDDISFSDSATTIPSK